jgi:hypothetical protein
VRKAGVLHFLLLFRGDKIKMLILGFALLNLHKMKKNIGSIDRAVRIVIAAVIVILAFAHKISGTLEVILLIFAGILVLTTAISFCPIWWALGIGTAKKQPEK